MLGAFRSIVAVTFIVCNIAIPVTAQTHSAKDEGPPVPYLDMGACPGEGCVYREWTANRTVVIRKDRRVDAPAVSILKRGERVRALTGVVVTLKAGRVRFREPVDIHSASGPLHIEPDDTLFLLTYEGEGFTKAWLHGKFYESVDTAQFLNRVCNVEPNRCPGKIIRKTQSEWWVQIRNSRGQVGWTKETARFDGMCALKD